MKFLLPKLITAGLALLLLQPAGGQVAVTLQKKIILPSEKIQLQSLQVLEDGTPVLVMNGGVYSPVDKGWLVPPDPVHPIQDVAVLKDATGAIKLCVLQMNEGKVELKALHRFQDGVPKFRTAQGLPSGLFHLSVMDSVTTIIWGKEKGAHAVYASTLQQTKKLLDVQAGINALQPFTNNSLLAAIAGNLMVITPDGTMKPVGTLPPSVLSMVVDARANIWVSSVSGIYVLPSGGRAFEGPLLDGGVGLLQVFGAQVWLADPVKKTLSCFVLK